MKFRSEMMISHTLFPYYGEPTNQPSQEISTFRASLSQQEDVSVAEVCLVLGLAFIHSRLYILAREHLEHAADIYGSEDEEKRELINTCLKLIPKPNLHVPMPRHSSR